MWIQNGIVDQAQDVFATGSFSVIGSILAELFLMVIFTD